MACEIVRAFDCFNLETPILTALRTSCLENNHCSHRVSALSIRDVVAFDTLWWCGQIKRLLQFLQRQLGFLAISEPLNTLLLQYFLSVLLYHFDQAHLFATFGHTNADCASTFLLEPTLDNYLVVWLSFDNHFSRDVW